VLKKKFQEIAALTPDTADDEMAQDMMAGKSGSRRILNDGVDSWVFYSFVKYADWTVVVVVPEAIIHHNGNTLVLLLLGILATGLLVIYVLSHKLIQQNLKQVKRFVTAAGEMAQGNSTPSCLR
jgi:sigma-B regulation protein RsbU (phosphoserine phosphatase)